VEYDPGVVTVVPVSVVAAIPASAVAVIAVSVVMEGDLVSRCHHTPRQRT